MADLSYDVRVNTRDAVNSITGLRTALTGLASAFAIGQVVQFADGITSLRNKLLTLTPDVAAVNKQFNALAAIAITSRAPLEATGDLFFRIQRSAKALGISTQEAATITDSLAKAMSASGLSAGEAAGPLLQLGQALQSGVFQGDELRSILEGMPVVAQALATELGVPVGALKKLGSEGQISADVFVKAMRKAKDSIDEAFGRTTPTITSALEGLRTNAKLAFDEFEKNTQTGRNLAATIEYIGFMFFKLTKNIDEFAGTIASILKWTAIIVSFTLVGKILLSFVGIIKTLGLAIFAVGKFFLDFYRGANALGTAVAGLAAPFKAFGNIIVGLAGAILGSGLGKLAGWIKDSYNAVSGFFDKITSAGDATSNSAKELEAYRAELAKMKTGLDDTATAGENAASIAKQVAQSYSVAALEMRAQTSNLERSLKQTRERLAVENEMMSLNREKTVISDGEIEIAKQLTDIDIERRNAIQEIRDNLAKLNLEYSQLVKKDGQKGKELADQIGLLKQQITLTNNIYDEHGVGMTNLLRSNQNLKVIEEDRKRTQENIIKGIEDQISRNQKLGDVVRSINGQRADVGRQRTVGETAGLSTIQKQILDIQDAAGRAARDASAAFAANFDSEDGLTPERAEELARGLDQISGAFAKLTLDQEAFAQRNYESSRTFQAGWDEAFTRFAESTTNTAEQTAQYFDKLTNGMADAFGKMAESGKWSFKDLKNSFKDLANSMIADFIRIMAKRAILGLMGGGGGFLSSLFGRANGGDVSGETPYIVGERGPELFIPKSAGTVISNSQLNSTGSGNREPVSVTYNISAVDASSFRSLVARDPSFIYAITEKGRQSQPRARMA
jgi:lambda family phage tail tape measure protein